MSKKTVLQQESAKSTWIDSPRLLMGAGLKEASQVEEIHSEWEVPVRKGCLSIASCRDGWSIATSRLRDACYGRLSAPGRSGKPTARVERLYFRGRERERGKGAAS